MFSWHEATRRRVCRLAFLALAMVPTCAVWAAAAWLRSAPTLAAHRRSLSEQLALEVVLTRVSFPRPQVTLYEGLELIDPQSGQSLARMRSLEIDRRGQRQLISCSQPELNAACLDLVWELASRRLRRQAALKQPLEVRAGQLTLHLPAGSQTLTDVRSRLLPVAGDSGPQAIVAFHLAGDEQGKESQLAVYRPRQPGGGAMLLQLETAEAVFPAPLMAALLPAWDALGNSATFTGSLWWQEQAEGWAGELRGAIGGLELDRFITQRFAHKLSGTARLQLDRAQFKHGRLTSAAGSLTAGPGLIGRPLLAALAAQLHAPVNPLAGRQGELIAYDQLAGKLVLDERGLSLQGDCRGSPAGTLIAGHEQALLKEPLPGFQSPLGIVRALAGDAGEVAPVSTAAQALVRCLPQLVPPGATSPQARLRLNESKR